MISEQCSTQRVCGELLGVVGNTLLLYASPPLDVLPTLAAELNRLLSSIKPSESGPSSLTIPFELRGNEGEDLSLACVFYKRVAPTPGGPVALRRCSYTIAEGPEATSLLEDMLAAASTLREASAREFRVFKTEMPPENFEK